MDGVSLGHPRWWPAPPPAVLPATVSLEPGYIWLLLLAFLNFGHVQKQSLVCAQVFLPKSECYYSVLHLSPRNWEGFWLLGRLMGLSCFCLQFSQSQHSYFQCSPGSSLASQPCLSHQCHVTRKGEIGTLSNFGWYFLYPDFSASCIFQSWLLHAERKHKIFL